MYFRTGGKWHITNMRRGESIFEINSNAHEEVERGFELEGSNLSGVSARCQWVEQDSSKIHLGHLRDQSEGDMSRIIEEQQEQIRTTLQKGLQFQTDCDKTNTNTIKLDESRDNNLLESTELLHVKKLDGVHLIFNLEAGSLLPLAIRYVIN